MLIRRKASLASARGPAVAGLKILPLLFVAMLSLAPTNAQAAGPTNGMFDCLGNLDWGCRVIGFLFQVTDNDLTYYKEGFTTAPESPTPAIRALRSLMEFFSNALLIIASIKLLYELIQMTAESAKTGQVGGKDTNTLWSPIRLVFAIGLLVPIANEGGLNSGQLIVLQISKWGSGLASQGWKLFASKLGDSESLSTPPAPRVQDLANTTVKIYACKGFINYYATQLALPNDIVSASPVPDGVSARYIFGNRVNRDICGMIRHKVPNTQTGTGNPQDAQLARLYAQENSDDFINAEGQIATQVSNLIQPFLPSGRTLPKPRTEYLDGIINNFQAVVTARVESSTARARQAMETLTREIQDAADNQGWTSAGSYFLRITRAEGQMINGAQNIPEAIGPNIEVFRERYASAYANYQEFLNHLNNGARPQDAGGGLTPAARAAITATEESQSFIDFMKSFLVNLTTDPAEPLFRFIDRAAITIGLWDADPRKAFGDLGSSTNPFGEIAELGHKKVRLGLNYISWAILATAGGALLGIFSFNATGALVSAISGILMLIATLFLMAGVLLAYIVPMLPFTRFFFSILTWLGSLIEAMILVPFMALAFLTPKGEGFSGPNTRNAFFLIFQLFLRPILCIIGLICAMLMFYVAAKFLNASFYAATSGVYGIESGSAMRFMQKLVYSFMYVALIYSAANISFKMIEHIPKHAMKWMGGSASEESYDDHGSFLSTAGAVGGAQLISQFQSLPQTLMSPLSKAGDGLKSWKDSRQAKKDKKEAEGLATDRQNQLVAAINGRNSGGDDGTPGGTPSGTPPRTPPGGNRGGAAIDPSQDDPSTRLANAPAPMPVATGGQDDSAVDGGDTSSQVADGTNGGPSGSTTAVAGDPPGPSVTRAASGTQPRQQIASGQPSQPRLATGSVDIAMSRIRADGGLPSEKENAVRSIVMARIQQNPNDIDGAVLAGLAARDSA